MNRDVPSRLSAQNERTRSGTWFSVSQTFFQTESIHFGWGHAFAADGDPGQHNTEGEANAPNYANLYTVAYKHRLGHGVTVYADYAATVNAQYAHYDLGAGGRSVTTDCHDAQLPALGDASGSPHCWAGGLIQGMSVGMNYRF
jgi:hypothetical protein